MLSLRYDFVLHANRPAWEHNKKGKRGEEYVHNQGVFKMRFQGLLACSIYNVQTEAILVYSKPNMERSKAEIELASLYVETEHWIHSTYPKVCF